MLGQSVNQEVSMSKECLICDGTGIILGDREYDHDDMPIQDHEDCFKCNGTGRVSERVSQKTAARNEVRKK